MVISQADRETVLEQRTLAQRHQQRLRTLGRNRLYDGILLPHVLQHPIKLLHDLVLVTGQSPLAWPPRFT